MKRIIDLKWFYDLIKIQKYNNSTKHRLTFEMMWPCTRKYVFHMKLKFSIYAPRIRFFLSDDVNLCKWITHQGCFENWNMSWSTRWFKRESYLYNFIPFVQPPFQTWPNFVSKMHWDIGNLSKPFSHIRIYFTVNYTYVHSIYIYVHTYVNFY